MKIDLHVGDAKRVLRALPPESVDCVVTSPPYWGLRDYGTPGQLGLERTPTRFIARMRGYFREVHRVLKPTGTLWLNMGDCHYTPRMTGGAGENSKINGKHSADEYRRARARQAPNRGYRIKGLKPKSLVGVPWMLAFALMHDPRCDWYLRMDNIWFKPNTTPESAKDRTTKTHEYLFLFSKAERYYYDADAIKEKTSPNTHARAARRPSPPVNHVPGQPRTRPQKKSSVAAWAHGPGAHEALKHNQPHGGRVKYNVSFNAAVKEVVEWRNKRSVWRVPTEAYKGAHFATFPTRLVEPCILAGCPEGGTVLDPFGGSGTVGIVAARHHRNTILIELSQTYADLAARRIHEACGLLASLSIKAAAASSSAPAAVPAAACP